MSGAMHPGSGRLPKGESDLALSRKILETPSSLDLVTSRPALDFADVFQGRLGTLVYLE